MDSPFTEEQLRSRRSRARIADLPEEEMLVEGRGPTQASVEGELDAEARAVYDRLVDDRGSGALDDGEPQHVVLSGREYERYLEGALNDPFVEDDGLAAVAVAVRGLLDAVSPERDDHTVETPWRAAKMWQELLRGEALDPKRHLAKTFSAPTDAGLVVQSGIEMTSVCAHHLLPFTGKATVAYRPSPGQSVVGLSKLTRVLQEYAARLQIQERICSQVVQAIHEVLLPAGAMCVITANHDCMRLRGVRDHGSSTTTVAKTGHLTADEISLIHADHLRKVG